MLRNPYYVGIVTFRGIEYEGTHEPLLSKDLFYKVQAELDAKRVAEERHRKHHHYLKGSLWCGHCGSRLIFTKIRGNGGLYDYFLCSGKQSKRTDCTMRYLPAADVEAAVQEHYREIEITEPRVNELRRFIAETLTAAQEHTQRERQRLERQLRKIEERRRKVLDAFIAGAIDQDLLAEEQAKARREAADTASMLDTANADLNRASINAEGAISILGRAASAYENAAAPLRRRLNQAVFTKLKVYETGHVTGELTGPFATLIDGRLLEDVHEAVLRTVGRQTHRRQHRPGADRRGAPSRSTEARNEEPCRTFRRHCSISEALVRLVGLEPAARRAIVSTILRLRDHLTILDIRELIPAMSALSRHHPVNQLAAEAIAAADVLGAENIVDIDTPQVRAIAAERGIAYSIA